MSTFAESRRDLDSYLAARVPVIGMRTIEQMRALRLRQRGRDQPEAGQPAVLDLHPSHRPA